MERQNEGLWQKVNAAAQTTYSANTQLGATSFYLYNTTKMSWNGTRVAALQLTRSFTVGFAINQKEPTFNSFGSQTLALEGPSAGWDHRQTEGRTEGHLCFIPFNIYVHQNFTTLLTNCCSKHDQQLFPPAMKSGTSLNAVNVSALGQKRSGLTRFSLKPRSVH